MTLVEYHKNDLIIYEIEKYPMFEILYLRLLKSNCNEEETKLNIDVLETYMKNRAENKKCFYFFYDVEKVSSMFPMSYVYKAVKLFKTHREILQKCLIKTFVVNSSSFIIGLSKIIFTFYTPVRPYEFVKNTEEAKEKLFKLNN